MTIFRRYKMRVKEQQKELKRLIRERDNLVILWWAGKSSDVLFMNSIKEIRTKYSTIMNGENDNE